MAVSILEALRAISAYPIPQRVYDAIAIERGINLADELTMTNTHSNNYCLAKADVYLWLSQAPNVTQGGQSYTISDEQRKYMRYKAQSLYEAAEESDAVMLRAFGYKGDRL